MHSFVIRQCFIEIDLDIPHQRLEPLDKARILCLQALWMISHGACQETQKRLKHQIFTVISRRGEPPQGQVFHIQSGSGRFWTTVFITSVEVRRRTLRKAVRLSSYSCW